MIKICFITTVYVTYRSFLKAFSDFLYLSDNYDISLICNEETGIRKDIPDYVHYYPVSMKRGVSISAFIAVWSIRRILSENRFDIVQYSTPNAAFYASLASKSCKIPNRLYCQWGIRYMGYEGWKRLAFKALEKKTCANSTIIEAESNNIREFSVKESLYTKEKSRVVWNGSACGVDLSKFNITDKPIWRNEIRNKYGISEDIIVFSFAGRLTADKGVNELLRAFFSVTQRHANTRLLIMGDFDNGWSLNPKLLQCAKESEHIVFTGMVNDIEHYYAASDIFVAPSYREGFGLAVAEAEAMGLPAVVSNVPGQIDAIKPGVTGLTCQIKDVDSLEKAMERLIIDRELRMRMGIAAVEYVKSDFERQKLFGMLMKYRNEMVR